MPPSDKIAYQARAVHDLIAQTSADQLGDSTPCSDWDVRALLTHLVGGATMLGGVFQGEPFVEPGDGPMPDVLGDDPAAAWDAAISAFNAGVDSPGAMEREVVTPMGAMPGAALLDYLTFDVLVHAWDLAQATRQSFDPPAEVVDPARAIAEAMLAPEMRDGDTFAAEQTPPSGATPIGRLAAFSGRST